MQERGLIPAGVRNVLTDVSELLHDKDSERERKESGKRKMQHCTMLFSAQGKSGKQKMWEAVEPDLSAARTRIKFKDDADGKKGSQNFSQILANGVARNAHGLGHGARGERQLDFLTFVDALIGERDGICMRTIEKVIAAKKKGKDHVGHLLEVKQLARATYAMIDKYRHLLLIKHASRGEMVAEAHRLVNFIGAHLICAGPEWVDEAGEAELRQIAMDMLLDEAEARAYNGAEAYRAFTKRQYALLADEGMEHRRIFKEISVLWKDAPENPKNQEGACRQTRSAHWQAAAKKAAEAAAERRAAEAEAAATADR